MSSLEKQLDQLLLAGASATLTPVPASSPASIPNRIKDSLTELGYLLRIQYAEVRETWIWVIVMASIFPFTTLLFMKFFLESPSQETILRIVSGNIIFPIIIMSINGLGNHIAWSKHLGQFTFYASLPISKVNFVLAVMTRGFLMTLPSVLIMSVVGQLVFGVHIHFSIGLIPMVILSVAGSAGFGILVGYLSPNTDVTNMVTNLLMVFLNFLTPVMIDIHQLPVPLQIVSYFFPTTYGADGLRHLFLGSWTRGVTVDMLVLLLFTVISYWIIVRKMDWRLE